MRAFACDNSGLLLEFKSDRCVRCGAAQAFAWETRSLDAYPDTPPIRCANAEIAACNWLPERAGELCYACRLTRTRPNDADEEGLQAFARAETAKRRLLFELGELGLPTGGGLRFDLLASRHE